MLTGLYARPAAFLLAVRWVGWLIAFIGVLSGTGSANEGISEPLLLVLTAAASGAECIMAARPRFRSPLTPDARRLLLIVAGIDATIGLAVIHLSGGRGSPFYHYAVTALLLPAFLLPLRWTMLWAGLFSAVYIAITVTGQQSGYTVQEFLALRTGTVTTPLLVAFVMWYLARLNVAVTQARERAEQSLAETGLLFRVAEATITDLSDVQRLVRSVSESVQRTHLFRAMWVQVRGQDGATIVDSGYGQEDGGVSVAMTVRGEDLGTLSVTPAAGVRFAGGDPGFVEALAQQVALGVYDARLFAQREELATQAERARIAREIHDGMAQSLYMLSLGLEACADAAGTEQGELGRRLGSLVGVSKQALWEARRYIFDLTPPAEGEHSLLAMLQNLTREFETVSRVPAALTVEGTPRRVEPEVAAALYRIGQEALANVFKHAQASRADVILSYLPGSVRLTVADNGRGLPAETRTGYGLGNMRRRAEDAGGSYHIESTPGTGTTVCVEVPSTDTQESISSTRRRGDAKNAGD